MRSETQRLASFAANLRYKDLRPTVRHQSIRLIYDALGCAVSGFRSHSTEVFNSVVLGLGGMRQATAIPSGYKSSAPHAAFLNAMSANAQDLDDNLLYHCHIGNTVIAGAAAIGELLDSSGKDLITAVAAGYEVAGRVSLSMPGVLAVDRKSKRVISTNPLGFGYNTIGAAVAAGRLLRLNEKEMAHALGIAAYSVPIPSVARSISGDRFTTAKTGMYGWQAWAGCMAALFAAQGVGGDDRVLEGPGAFWKMNGAPWVDMGVLTEKLGTKWWLMDVSFKLEAAGTWMRPALQALRVLLDKYEIGADEIQRIEARVHPLGKGKIFHQTIPKSYLDAQVSYHYLLAATALRIPNEKWQLPRVYKGTAIRKMIKRVQVLPDRMSTRELQRELAVRPHRATGSLTTIKVYARGKEFVERTKYGLGDPQDPGTRASDSDLDAKFARFAAPVLGRKATRVPEIVWALDRRTSTRELVRAMCRA